MKTLILIVFLFFIAFNVNGQDYTLHVDPFIGTEGGGNIFPGPSLPFGMVKLGPDCGELTTNSGYDSDGNIKGFSLIHVSGTGGGPKYGNVLLSPVVGDINLNGYSSPRLNEKASVGYYAVNLSNSSVKAELTASHRAGFQKYTFPASKNSNILIDLGSFLTISWCEGCDEEQKFVGAEVEIINDTLVEGYTRVKDGWNLGEAYTVYFSAIFDTPAKAFGTWKGKTMKPGNKMEFDSGEETGAYLSFQTKEGQEIQVKIGISFLGRMKARQNVMNEIPGWDFDKLKQNAVDEWNKYLGRIKVETKDEDLKTIFYTALYHSILQPTDRTGENPLWTSNKPYYDDFYAIWDTYRATHPLFMFLCPERQRDILNAMIDIYEQEGFMPDARSGNETGRTQGGSNCDVLIADAFVKGLEEIDYEKALASMIKNAEVPPGDDAMMKGRGGLLDYNSLGYVSVDYERAGSRTVEYAYNDYCIYLIAKGLGKDSIADIYLKRSNNWKNLWKPVSDHGAKGFIMPRNADGSWDEDYIGRAWNPVDDWHQVDFTVHTAGSWPDFFYEGDSWIYSLYVPHDVNGLIEKCGGENAFLSRLDTFFTKRYFNISNEPSFLTPSLYSYAGKPEKTGEIVRDVIANKYSTTRSGLPGNDDSGSMSAWAAFNLMGFFPNAGQDIYLFTAPHFDEIVIKLEDGKELKIIVKNLSPKNTYIKSVVLNGKKWDKSWFRHGDIANGGIMEIVMSAKLGDWGKMDLPPSASDLK